jgi:predicted signal transduction protein with EAL and GGDEF domain
VTSPFHRLSVRASASEATRSSSATSVRMHSSGARPITDEDSRHQHVSALRPPGLYGRTITATLKRARRKATPLAIIMADIDHFKAVNEQRGQSRRAHANRRRSALSRKEQREKPRGIGAARIGAVRI